MKKNKRNSKKIQKNHGVGLRARQEKKKEDPANRL